MAQNKDFSGFSMEQAVTFAASPAGKQLMAMLQQRSGADFGKARDYAAVGDMERAKAELSSLLSDPKVMALLKQFGG